MKKAKVIIGMGYGDEGKGRMTDYFCSRARNAVVVRYNGGSQAGHTVVLPDGKRHVFGHIGSGALCGVPTYLSNDFVVNPIVFNKEYNELIIAKSWLPVTFNMLVGSRARVTFPTDVLTNQILESSRSKSDSKHGSCGLGIFETINRNLMWESFTIGQLQHYSLSELKQLLINAAGFSMTRLKRLGVELSKEEVGLFKADLSSKFYYDLSQFLAHTQVIDEEDALRPYSEVVFEGAQGLLLSESHGVHPYLTPSDPGLMTPLRLCKENGLQRIEVCYVTRAYSTRHGAGPLEGECSAEELGITPNEAETNQPNPYQGDFRYARLSCDRFEAANTDFASAVEHQTSFIKIKKTVAITCVDQINVHNNVLGIVDTVFDQCCVKSGYITNGPSRVNTYKIVKNGC